MLSVASQEHIFSTAYAPKSTDLPSLAKANANATTRAPTIKQ